MKSYKYNHPSPRVRIRRYREGNSVLLHILRATNGSFLFIGHNGEERSISPRERSIIHGQLRHRCCRGEKKSYPKRQKIGLNCVPFFSPVLDSWGDILEVDSFSTLFVRLVAVWCARDWVLSVRDFNYVWGER